MLELGIDCSANMDDGDDVVHSPGFYTGPTPAPPACPNPFAVPPASTLSEQIIDSVDKLFFISWRIGTKSCEWRLVRVALRATTASYPSCFEDGKYSVDFYTSHPSDSHMNAVNQRYWLRYHSRSDLMGPCPPSDTHLIRPTDTSEAYASRHNLLPFHQHVNLTHSNPFIHGPFDFTILGGRKSRDRVGDGDWRILRSNLSMFKNLAPPEDITTYSVHIDACAHTISTSGYPVGDVLLLTALAQEFQRLYP
jgi:hypothetical protein